MAAFDINNFDINTSMCIEASAGTGKTFTVQLIVAELMKLNALALQENQNKILTDDEKSVLHKTPAINLENILIVTYTEKAAGELRDRIRAKIQEVIENEDYTESNASPTKYLPVAEQKQHFHSQLSLVDNAPIFTIHSFCKQTLSEYGFDAKQSDNLELIDEAQVSSFIDKWIRDILPENKDFEKLLLLTKGGGINKQDYIKSISTYYLKFDGTEDPEIIVLDKSLSDSEVENLKRYSLHDIKEYITLTGSKSRFNPFKLNAIFNFAEKIDNSQNNNDVTNLRTADEAKKYRINLEALLKETEERNRTRTSAARTALIEKCTSLIDLYDKAVKYGKADINFGNLTGISKTALNGASQSLFDYFIDLKDTIDKVYKFNNSSEPNNNYDTKLKTLIYENQLPQIYYAWNQYKAENKFQSFDDMIRNVRETVCQDNSELKQRIKEKYKYAIIDEFQDTNQKQWDIFSRIFMEDSAHSICVVGDPKQSIYAFQGADINVYSQAIEQIKNGNPALNVLPGKNYILDTNYRSTNKVIEVCNALFDGNYFFNGNNFTFTKSECPKKPKLVKPDAEFDGKKIKPLWIPLNTDMLISEEDFACFAAERIIECCTYKNGKTNLQIYKKGVVDQNDNLVLTDVSFGDFAVLCKTKSEMTAIKETFAKLGIPFNHYKESNLFSGKECSDWIALFKAIEAEDFTSINRKILNECLYSSFFDVPLSQLQSSKYDIPNCQEKILIIEWKKLASERKWALLQEQIFEKTKVEERLSQLDKLSSLSKLRQIGDYCVNYLYKNGCTVSELLNHLNLLASQKTDTDDEDGNIVEKRTDFDSVQIMTIHASKGLEFPVVIAAAGFRKPMSQTLYCYHDEYEKFHICKSSDFPVINNTTTAADKTNKELYLEYMRLFYVAYTRATSLMILPWGAEDTFTFLKESFTNSAANDDKYLERFPNVSGKDPADLKKEVQKILAAPNAKKDEQLENEKEDDQREVLQKMKRTVSSMNVYKLSYSNLSKHSHSNQQTEDSYESDKQENHERERDSDSKKSGHCFDSNSKQICCSYDANNLICIDERYPKGDLLGNAVHQSFELADFISTGSLENEESAVQNAKLRYLTCAQLKSQGFKIDSEDSKNIIGQTCKILWNTMNAVFPEIKGAEATGNLFSLKSLPKKQYFSEMEFNMNPAIKQNKDVLKDYFNGFIDLLFVREQNGKKVYSIADWKTNSMPKEDYADANNLKAYTDKNFAIQRVLYSYCLIKWLCQYNPGKSESEIFEEQFGGVYYVYVRGCKAGIGNGIYAQTWKCWDDLNAAFNEIVEKFIG